MPNLPEFSDSNYNIAGYVVALLITLSGAFFVYEVLFNGDLTFSANWNIFKSPLGSICIFIGFICAIAFWGKMGHWSRTPILETRDSSGNLIKREENFDVMEQGFAKILMPILGHFVLEPIVYGCLIYYPIQVVIALVGTIFPYVLTLIVLAIVAGSWLYTKKCHFRYHSALLVLMGVVFTAAFAWGGYAIHNATPGSTIQMLADTQPTDGGDGMAAYDENDEQTETDQDSESNEDNAINNESEENEEDYDGQFEGVGEEGLYGSLPEGTTAYAGDMAGFPIELNITKKGDSGEIYAMYKNVRYGSTMRLDGESLPADGGDINFYGKDGDTQWVFNLSGDANNISGTARGGEDKEMKVTLKKK